MEQDDINKVARQIEMGLARMDSLRGQMDSLKGQMEALRAVIIDHGSSMDSLKELKTGSSDRSLIGLGSQVFINVRIEDTDHCILSEGAGIYIKRDIDTAISAIEDRKKVLEDVIERLGSQLNEMAEAYNSLAAQTQELYGQQMLMAQGTQGNF
ncbi:MAG: prefoldin subunit alpha [Candidatus Thermoplasmatota archaeon]|nr:prefoldin subunit alpha [Candidatus Thermoplasmatota archaeon]